jgi:hypothetical protein
MSAAGSSLLLRVASLLLVMLAVHTGVVVADDDPDASASGESRIEHPGLARDGGPPSAGESDRRADLVERIEVLDALLELSRCRQRMGVIPFVHDRAALRDDIGRTYDELSNQIRALTTSPLGDPVQVFLAPLKGEIGGVVRAEELAQIGKEADCFGPGQVIIVKLFSNGGVYPEAFKIADQIAALRQRHRVVIWVDKAVHAANIPMFAGREILFTSTGLAGTVWTWNPGPEYWIPDSKRIAGRGLGAFLDPAAPGHHDEIMQRAVYCCHLACSYDRDIGTGEVVFHPDDTGAYQLIPGECKQPCNFSNSSAWHCGLSSGTADTTDELIAMLGLQRPHVRNDFGERLLIARREFVELARNEIQRLTCRFKEERTVELNSETRRAEQLEILDHLLSWVRSCPDVAEMEWGLSDTVVEQALLRLREQPADKSN